MSLIRSTYLLTFLLPFSLSAQLDTATVRVLRNGKSTPVGFARLKALPPHDARIVAHDGNEATYAGVWMVDVLKLNDDVAAIQKRVQVNTYVSVNAADGYSALIALPECDSSFRQRPVLLAWMKDGQPLDTHDGPFQVIVPDDRKHARDVRQVRLLDVITP